MFRGMALEQPAGERPAGTIRLDVRNLMGLQAAAHALDSLTEQPLQVGDRLTRLQALGEEVEQRAKELISQVRALRGLEEPGRGAPKTAPPPPPAPPDKVNGAMVRDSAMRLGRFTLSELVADIGDYPQADVKKYVKVWMTSKVIRETGERFGRSMIFEFVPPESVPVNREDRRPPERDNPAYTEARATGMPVRVSAQKKITRRGRSTPGVGHRAKQQDKRYEDMMSAQEKRANEQRFKEMRARAQGKK